jgi:hypothetical protein
MDPECRVPLGQMSFADEYAVNSKDLIFHHAQNAVGDRFSGVHERIQQSILALNDDDALAADPGLWAEEIAADFAVTPPTLDTGGHEFTQEGRVAVECSNWPGISFSTSEFGRPVVRAGHRFRVTMLGDGDLSLLKSRLTRGGTGRKVDLHTGGLSRVYEWPQVRPAEELQGDVDQFLADLDAGVQEIAEQITKRNGALAPLVVKLLTDRQTEIRQSRAYLGDLRLTVSRDPVADTIIPALPKRVPGPGSATRSGRPPAASTSAASLAETAPPKLNRPTLDDFYGHVVTVLGAVVVGFERSPGHFADVEEEALRDFILVTLNSHYEGAATGETFNGNGKTDILVRHGLDNAFIGECKFWGGETKLAETFEQLLGYTTWKDNRLALILFVRNKKMQPVIDTTRAWIGARPEFGGWQANVPDGQLRCTLHWEDQARKEARLTIFLIHLPRA